VGYPHPIKGTGIYTYVVLNEGVGPSDDLKKELAVHVRKVVGPIATPDKIQFARDLPKTRSGKIMRRILRKIAAGERDMDAFGDLSTLADPKVVRDLLSGCDRTSHRMPSDRRRRAIGVSLRPRTNMRSLSCGRKMEVRTETCAAERTLARVFGVHLDPRSP